MDLSSKNPFETIESAQRFVELLSEAVVEAKRDLSADVRRESVRGISRRLDALRIALYNVEKLELHMRQGTRILNDLRMVRRLLFQERGASGHPSVPTAAEMQRDIPPGNKSLAA